MPGVTGCHTITPMTLHQYERLYTEALVLVRAKIRNVGPPETTVAGRVLRVSEMLCDDEIVFILAWGKETARSIMSQRPPGEFSDPSISGSDAAALD